MKLSIIFNKRVNVHMYIHLLIILTKVKFLTIGIIPISLCRLLFSLKIPEPSFGSIGGWSPWIGTGTGTIVSQS